MRLGPEEARRRFAAARVARLATADASGVPHIVPVTFAVEGDAVYFGVDHKPKRSGDLRRLRNIRENPRVALLADLYDDDWSRLWWSRADGRAEIVEGGPRHGDAEALLRGRYGQYREGPPVGPVVVVRVERWSGWAFGGGGPESVTHGPDQ